MRAFNIILLSLARISVILCMLFSMIFNSFTLAQEHSNGDSLSNKDNAIDYPQGKADGKKFAKEYFKDESWTVAGFICGMALGPIGTGAAAGFSQIDKIPTADTSALTNYSRDYIKGYFDGYKERVKKKRLSDALIGGIVGTAMSALIIISLNNWNI